MVEATIEFLQYQLRTSNIEVVTRLDPLLPQLMLAPHQVQQVFLNILNNARQAIETHRPSGRITLTTERRGQSVRVLFQDNGPGIAEGNLSNWKMPGLSGQQVYERLRASAPLLSERLVFISGDVVNEKTQKFLEEHRKICLSKAFSLVEFRAAVSRAIDEN
jgi:signal transduction histidine kinase